MNIDRIAGSLGLGGSVVDAARSQDLVRRWRAADPDPDLEAEIQLVAIDAWRRAGHPDPEAAWTETAPPAKDEFADSAPWPDPPHPAAFHGLAGEIVKTIEPYTEADPVAILIQLLVAAGNAIHRAPHFRVESDRHRLNLFAVLVGATSKGRKGSSWGHVRRLFEAADDIWARDHIVSGLSSGEGLIWAVRDEIRKNVPVKANGSVTYEEVVDDPGVEDKRILVLEAEFASTLKVMGRDGSTLSAVVRQAWDSGNLRTLTKTSPARSTDAHISIIGHVTSDELRRYLDQTEAGNGFMNRFLTVCVRRSKCLPEGAILPDEVLVPIALELRQAVASARGASELKRDEEARALWYDVYPTLSEGRPGLLGAVTSRAEAQVLRLSMLYALLDRSRVITRPHLEAALAFWNYAEASAAFVFGTSLGDPVADEVLHALRQAGGRGLTRTEIRDLFGRHQSADRIASALSGLEAGGLARREKRKTAGRPAQVWITDQSATKAMKATEGFLSHNRADSVADQNGAPTRQKGLTSHKSLPSQSDEDEEYGREERLAIQEEGR